MDTESEDDRLLRILRDPLLWALLDRSEPVDPRTLALFARIDAEHAAAAALCDALLAGPSSQWEERVRNSPQARTLWVVLQLLGRVPALMGRHPAEALVITSLAVEIAEGLDPRDYRPDYVILARGRALCDHAFVLNALGLDREAQQSVERAESALAQVPAEELDLARLAMVKAAVLRRQNRSEEAIALVRQAAATFREVGDDRHYVSALVTEAVMRHDAEAVEKLRPAYDAWRASHASEAASERDLQALTRTIEELIETL